jgi:hypothetical protein
MKFDSNWLVSTGSVHNGGQISSKYYDQAGNASPGIKADGTNKFLVGFEFENSSGPSPGLLDAYIYWPEQYDIWGDHFYPSGTVIPNSYARSGAATFGPQFTARNDFKPALGRWYCYETMVKANTPGQRDGRLAIWVDGRLAADFPNMRLRDVDTLKIDCFGIGVYIASNTEHANQKWHDDVVAATSYIGPMMPASAAGVYGDANDDGAFTMADLNVMVDWLLVRTAPPAAGTGTFTRCDVNGDGNLDMADLNLYVDRLLGRITKFPAEP